MDNQDFFKAYACYNLNTDVRIKSSSGGIFTLLAEKVIDLGGVVFGAQFDEIFNAVHSYIEYKEEIYKYRGSKYVQSQIGESYKKVKEFLENDRYVLFTGTPCQVEGLNLYLQKTYEKLYTQDIICHGTPMPKVWKKYLEYMEKEGNSKIQDIQFRDKSMGWKTYRIVFKLKNGNQISQFFFNNPYMQLFLQDAILREPCYNCSLKKINKNSDITLGDFWGIDKVLPEMNDNNGISLVIINSKKGEDLLKMIQNEIQQKEVDINNVVRYNNSIIKSANKNKNRKKILKNLEKLEFNQLADRYITKNTIIKRAINKIKRNLKIRKI